MAKTPNHTIFRSTDELLEDQELLEWDFEEGKQGKKTEECQMKI